MWGHIVIDAVIAALNDRMVCGRRRVLSTQIKNSFTRAHRQTAQTVSFVKFYKGSRTNDECMKSEHWPSSENAYTWQLPIALCIQYVNMKSERSNDQQQLRMNSSIRRAAN